MNTLVIRDLGVQDYCQTWQAMRDFTEQRTPSTPDEIWLVEHPPVFTLGQNGRSEHILDTGTIPVIKADRGGQVTYHGPGQLLGYVLLNLRTQGIGVRNLVTHLEQSIIGLLSELGINGQTRCDAPGVYVNDAKICSIGLRIRHWCSYHGLALNVAMDLSPFERIHPCGYQGLRMTQIQAWQKDVSKTEVKSRLLNHLLQRLTYQSVLNEGQREPS